MKNEIDYISLENLGWVHFKPNLVSFGHHNLPPDIHFTISFDSRSDDINFHLTRNVSDAESKPKITIACITKDLLSKLQGPIAQAFFSKLFVPLDIKFWRNKYGRRLNYLSFADIEKDRRKGDIESKMENDFKKVSSVKRKTRLKVRSLDEDLLKTMFMTAKMRNLLLDNLDRFPKQFPEGSDTGFLIAGKNIVQFIRINEDWFQINQRLHPVELLFSAVDLETQKDLIDKFTESLLVIKTAETYKDTEPYDIPIRLLELS